MTISAFNAKVDRIIQDDAGKLSPGEIDSFILEALSYYNKDAPLVKVVDISGNGGFQYDLPNDWVEGFSRILSVEYPPGKQVPVILEPGEYKVYKLPAGEKLHFFSLRPPPTETIRITYTTTYTQSIIDSVPTQDQDAFCNLAAALCCGALSRHYAQTSDSLIDADSVSYQNKSNQYAKRAEELLTRYNDFLGKKGNGPQAASGIKDWDTNYSWGGDYLTHPKKQR